MIKKAYDALFANDDIIFFDEDFGSVTFFDNEINTLCVDLDEINFDDVYFLLKWSWNYYLCQNFGLV